MKTEQVVNVVEEAVSKNISICDALNWKILFSELVATILLVFFGCMGSMPVTNEVVSDLYSPLAFGMVVGILVQSFGHLSGAHMNPAVTLASWIVGLTSSVRAVAFVIIQVVGAIIGYGLLYGLTIENLAGGKVCCTVPYPGLKFYHAIGIEFFLTAALIFVNCAIWDPVNKDKQDSAAVKFAMTIIGLSLVGGPMTGASMNPARSLGPAVWTDVYDGHWYYWVGPMLGSTVAALIYKYIWLENDEKKNQS